MDTRNAAYYCLARAVGLFYERPPLALVTESN